MVFPSGTAGHQTGFRLKRHEKIHFYHKGTESYRENFVFLLFYLSPVTLYFYLSFLIYKTAGNAVNL